MDMIFAIIIGFFASFILGLGYLLFFSLMFIVEWPLMSWFNNFSLPNSKDTNDYKEKKIQKKKEEFEFIEKSDLNKSTIEYSGKAENEKKDDADYSQYGYYKNKK